MSDFEGTWYEKDILRCIALGDMVGDPDGAFRPEDKISRGEMASILARRSFRDGMMQDVVKTALPSIVLVITDAGLGSGSIISNDGFILTAAHVVKGQTSVTIVSEEFDNIQASVVGFDESTDLGLVKIPRLFFNWLKISPTVPERGDHIGVLGAPKGLSGSFTQGVISHPRRFLNLFSEELNFMQTDCPINPGNSGGPALNEKGEIVGVVSAKWVDVAVDNIAWIVKTDKIREFLAKWSL